MLPSICATQSVTWKAFTRVVQLLNCCSLFIALFKRSINLSVPLFKDRLSNRSFGHSFQKRNCSISLLKKSEWAKMREKKSNWANCSFYGAEKELKKSKRSFLKRAWWWSWFIFPKIYNHLEMVSWATAQSLITPYCFFQMSDWAIALSIALMKRGNEQKWAKKERMSKSL